MAFCESERGSFHRVLLSQLLPSSLISSDVATVTINYDVFWMLKWLLWIKSTFPVVNEAKKEEMFNFTKGFLLENTNSGAQRSNNPN